MERGAQLGERFRRRVPARSFVHPELDVANRRRFGSFRRSGKRDPQRDDLFVESAGIDRGEGALMAAQREGILCLARDAGFARVVLGDEACRQVHVRVSLDERGIGRHLEAAHRHQAHRLGAAGEDGVCLASGDALGGLRDRLQAGRAESIDGDRRRRHRNPCPQAGDPRHVQSLLGFRHRAADDHVVDLGGVEARCASQRLRQNSSRHVVRSRRPERAGRRLAGCGANGRDDDGVRHVSWSVSMSVP